MIWPLLLYYRGCTAEPWNELPCIEPMVVPKVEAGEWAIVPKVELGEQRVSRLKHYKDKLTCP